MTTRPPDQFAPVSSAIEDIIADADRQLTRKGGCLHEVRLTRGQWAVVEAVLRERKA